MTIFDLKADPLKAYLEYVNEFLTITGFISYYGFSNEEGHELIAEGKRLLGEIDDVLQAHYGEHQNRVRSALFTMADQDTKKFHEYLITLTTKLRLDSE